MSAGLPDRGPEWLAGSSWRAAAPSGIPAQAALRHMTARHRAVGWLVVVVFVLGGGGWAWLAPLSSAAIAPGVVGPEGKRKTVQHLEGGIIREIHVQEGSAVHAGDPLVALEDVRARSERAVLHQQSVALQAEIARLRAELHDAAEISFPGDVEASRGDAELDRMIAMQVELFEAYRAVRQGRKRITAEHITQLLVENRSLAQQTEAQATQLELIDVEIDGVQDLLAKGLERKPRLLALQRTKAGVGGDRAAVQGNIASNLAQISQVQLEDLNAENQDRREINAALDDARKRLDEVQAKLPASEDALTRTMVRAPIDGRVVDLKATTIGGVLKPGEAILDIMPSRAELVIQARLRPADIKDVRRDLPARVVLTAYPQRNLPIIHGSVREVSADRLMDDRTGQPFFEVQVAVDDSELANLTDEVALLSGMPAEVFILTSDRTLLDYLLRPFYEAVRRAFRER